MAAGTERRVALPASERSPGLAREVVREAVRSAYAEAAADLLLDEALLLTTELVTNAVVHAGTELVIRVAAGPDELTISVTDASPGVLDPTPAAAPASMGEGGRGLYLVAALADAWGTTHDRAGKGVWFRLRAGDAPRPPASPERDAAVRHAAVPDPAGGDAELPVAPAQRAPLSARDLTWVTAIPEQLRRHLSPEQLMTELLHRLLESLGAAGAAVWADHGDGEGPRQVATAGLGAALPRGWPRQAEARRDRDGPDLLVVPLSFVPPVRGVLALATAPHPVQPHAGLDVDDPDATALAVLAAERIALIVQHDLARSEEDRQRGALSFLAEASQLLAGSLSSDLTLTLLAQLAVPRLGGWCAVYAVDARDEPVLAAVSHADERLLPQLRARLTGEGDAGPEPVADGVLDGVRQALRTRATVPIGRPGDGVVLPLVARRQVLGAMTLGRFEDRPHTADDTAIAEDLTRRAALALDNARLYEDRTAIAQALQKTLLPAELPSGPGLDLGARYVAAGEGTVVGGDFYDVVPLAPGRWLLAVGDVCGKGAEAASVTGLVRDVIRLLSREGRPIEDMLRALNSAVLDQGDRGRFCTVAVALVEEAGEALDVTLCLAGHLRPVALAENGTAALVGATGTVVGILDELDLHLTTLRLAPGDSLVFYTDGVTERRNGPRMFGEDNLLETLRSAAGLAADQVAARLQAAASDFARDPLRDDLAVLVVRRPPASSATPEQRSADTVGASA